MSSDSVKTNFPDPITSKRKMSSLWVLMCISFVIWGNSTYAPVGKNKGFHCNDTSISEIYSGDSISAGYLFLSLLGGALIVTYVTELLCFHQQSALNRFPPGQFSTSIKTYYAGFVYVLAFTEVLKLLFSELRPHFLHSCQPDFSLVNCSEGLVTEYRCTGQGPRWLVEMDIYKSFPSGHASLSCFTFAFLSTYVLKRRLCVPRVASWFWKSLVVLGYFAWAFACCISRAMDHRHFWWDIMAGVVIGTIGGLVKVNLLMSKHIFTHYSGKTS